MIHRELIASLGRAAGHQVIGRSPLAQQPVDRIGRFGVPDRFPLQGTASKGGVRCAI